MYYPLFVLNRKSGHFDEPDDIDKVGGRIMLTLSGKRPRKHGEQ